MREVRTSFFLLGINRLRASCLNAFCESTEKAQTGALSQNPSIGIPLGVTLCGGIHKPPSISLYSETILHRSSGIDTTVGTGYSSTVYSSTMVPTESSSSIKNNCLFLFVAQRGGGCTATCSLLKPTDRRELAATSEYAHGLFRAARNGLASHNCRPARMQ